MTPTKIVVLKGIPKAVGMQEMMTSKFAVYVDPLYVLVSVMLNVPKFVTVAPFTTTLVPETLRKVCAGLKVGIIPQLCV